MQMFSIKFTSLKGKVKSTDRCSSKSKEDDIWMLIYYFSGIDQGHFNIVLLDEFEDSSAEINWADNCTQEP